MKRTSGRVSAIMRPLLERASTQVTYDSPLTSPEARNTQGVVVQTS